MTVKVRPPMESQCRPESSRVLLALCGIVLSLAIVGCASSPRSAPVEDRGLPQPPSATTPAPLPPPVSVPALDPSAATPVAPIVAPSPTSAVGTYVVRPGDTLMRIGVETGQNWRDIARWNGIDNSNVLEVGQTLRVVAPGSESAAVGARAVQAPGKVDTKPLDAGTRPDASAAPVVVAAASAATATAASTGAPPSAPASAAPVITAAPPSPAEPRGPDDDIPWMWPASGNVVAGFDEATNKGLSIGGKAGDAVVAAAEGRVVYAGSGLRGYGNLVIIKHNNTYLTAYAHNRSLLVKEDQVVRRGQKIAEMGNSDADRVKLHFEIRKQGKPIDPANLLPTR